MKPLHVFLLGVMIALAAGAVLLFGSGDDPDHADAADVPPPLPAEVTYVALGDSLATGTGAQTSFPAEYATATEAATGSSVSVVNLAVDGWTSEDLLTAVTTDEQMRQALRGAHLVTVVIGGNDLLRARLAYHLGACGGADGQDCLRAAISGLEERWPAILDEVLALTPDHARVRAMDLYDPFVAVERDREDFEMLRSYLHAANELIAAESADREVPVAGVSVAFNAEDGLRDPVAAGLISDDRLHPSDAGHRLIAERIAELGW